MAPALQLAQNHLLSSSRHWKSAAKASLHVSSTRTSTVSLPKLSSELNLKDQLSLSKEASVTNGGVSRKSYNEEVSEVDLVAKMYAIAEAAADRAEMHAIICEQRNNWNVLLLNSVNAVTLTASLMAGAAAIPTDGATTAFKISSALLFAAATGIMAISGKIQPSQLAEEQRKATQLFKELERSIYNSLAIGTPTEEDIEMAMERVLAIDKAYPLPLLPGMLEKFPETIEPAVWWPKKRQQKRIQKNSTNNNGWSKELEKEMKGILKVLKLKDEEQYTALGGELLHMNKLMAISGPLLAGVAAVGTSLIGASPMLGQLPATVGVVGGALAAIVYNLEHAGQVGMVFEICRNCSGFYRQLEEEIEWNLGEEDWEKRDNGEMFEMKMALKLARNVSELKKFSCYDSAPCQDKEDVAEFAGKLL